MWLNNYYNLLWASYVNCLGVLNTTYNVPAYREYDGTLKSTTTGQRTGGNTFVRESIPLQSLFTAIRGDLSMTTNQGSSNNIALRAVFGTGTTAVSADDYAMSNLITSGLSFGVTPGFDIDNRVITQTLTVTAENDVTITEVGLAFAKTLVYRTVPSEPIELLAGESVNIVFTLNLTNGVVEVGI